MSARKALPLSPIDPRDDLAGFLAFHQRAFGGFRMEDDGGSGDGGDSGDAGSDDKGSDKGDDDADPPALTAERTARKDAETLLAELTGKSKNEVRRALKNGPTAALAALKPAEKDDKPTPKADDAPDADAIRREAEREAQDRANARIVRSEVRALAAESFTNPVDALHNLDLDDYEVNDDGELVDPKKVRADLAAVLKANPHYGKKTGPKPDPSQGKGDGRADRPSSMAELARWNPT